jgi:hypothetical protein
MKHMLNEEASAGLMISIVLIIFGGAFVWMGAGYVIDILVHLQNGMVTSALPMSADRLNTTNYLIFGFQAMLTLGIIAPAIVYAVAVAKRRDYSVVN